MKVETPSCSRPCALPISERFPKSVSNQGTTGAAPRGADERQRALARERWQHMLVERLLKHAVGIALLMGGWACSAQQAPIPFAQIQRDAQLSAELTAPVSISSVFSAEPAAGSSTSAAPSVLTSPAPASAAAGFVFAPPAKAPRTLDAHYFLLNGLHLELAALDIAMTRRCIDDGRCREGNPLMPSSLAGQLGVGFALVGSGAVSSYWLKKRNSRFWRIAPVTGIASHCVGLASGIAHQ